MTPLVVFFVNGSTRFVFRVGLSSLFQVAALVPCLSFIFVATVRAKPDVTNAHEILP